MARARRKKQGVSWMRVALIVMALLWIALAVAWWSLRQHGAATPALSDGKIAAEQNRPPSVPPISAGGVGSSVKGRLEIRKPPRDTQLGVTADSAVLLRIVEMYQWHERCELSGGPCKYEVSWSPGYVDSGKFHMQDGHVNPRPPFADARFVAGEIRLGDVVIDPKLLEEQAAQDFPVKESALPPNLAATFSVIDGVLYAGGDATHPQVGAVRVRYRIVPAGEVELSGVKRGNRLEAK
jgi:hypothetical protein